MKRKAKSKQKRSSPAPAPVPPPRMVTINDRLADAHAEYIRAKHAKDSEPSKTNVEAFHRAHGLLNRLEKEIKVLTPAAGVMTRKR